MSLTLLLASGMMGYGEAVGYTETGLRLERNMPMKEVAVVSERQFLVLSLTTPCFSEIK